LSVRRPLVQGWSLHRRGEDGLWKIDNA